MHSRSWPRYALSITSSSAYARRSVRGSASWRTDAASARSETSAETQAPDHTGTRHAAALRPASSTAASTHLAVVRRSERGVRAKDAEGNAHGHRAEAAAEEHPLPRSRHGQHRARKQRRHRRRRPAGRPSPPPQGRHPPARGCDLVDRERLSKSIDRSATTLPLCPARLSKCRREKLVMSRGHDQLLMPHVPMPASERTFVRTVVPALLAALALGATPARCFAGVRLSVCANQGPAACATCACSPARPPAALAAAPARRAAAGGVRCSAGARDGAPRHAGTLPAVAAGLCLACAVALSAGPRSPQTHRPLPPRATSGAPVDS